MNRRDWLRSSAGLLGAARLAGAAQPFRHPIGVQLYTVRNVFRGHEEDVLNRIAALGYTEIEATAGDNLDLLQPILDKDHLKIVSLHINSASLNGKAEPIGETIARAKKHGVEYLVYPYMPPPERVDAAGYERFSDQLNQAGEQCRAAGLAMCYHNHAFEFGGSPGKRPIDIFAAKLDPKLVGFEIDVFWVSVAGNDPVAILNEFKGRVPLVHLKDKLAGAPVQYDERVKAATFREVGSGALDFPAILKTAESVGVKHFFVEQDQTPGDPVDSLKKSYAYLRSLNV